MLTCAVATNISHICICIEHEHDQQTRHRTTRGDRVSPYLLWYSTVEEVSF